MTSQRPGPIQFVLHAEQTFKLPALGKVIPTPALFAGYIEKLILLKR